MRKVVVSICWFMACIAGYDVYAFVLKQSSLKERRRTGSSSIIISKASNQQPEDMSGLFPGDGPYVPSGMSAEEYKKLKLKESEALKKMNFGAWGPRFKQTDVPDGDWMVMPNLWTSGTITNRPGQTSNGFNTVIGSGNQNNNITIIKRLLRQPQYIMTFLRQNGPGLLLTYIMLDLIISAITMYTMLAVSTMTPPPNPMINKRFIWTMMKHALIKHKNLLVLSWIQTLFAKISLSIIFVPFSNAFLVLA